MFQAPLPNPQGPTLEERIGQRWMAWVGAVVIVLGASFLVKLGYDAGLWGKLSPLARSLLVAGLGAVLLLAGEVALRWIGPAASAGLFGAGLGTLYLDSYASFQWFELLPRDPAFLLMGLVALVGFGLTLHTRFLSIGALSMIGGYLTPLLIVGRGGRDLEVGVYLTVLLGVALSLSAVRRRPFRPLRYLALGGQGLVGLIWIAGPPPAAWHAALFFACLWWVMVVAETLIAALRRQSAMGNVVVSLLGTAWVVTIGCWILAESRPAGTNWLGLFTGAVGVLAAAVAAQFGPRPADLARPRTAIDALAIAMWAQAGVLAAAAIALQFDGYGESIGWLAIGLASIEIGRRLGFKAIDIFGLIVGSLAVLRVAVVDWQLPAMQGVVANLGQVTVTNHGLLALAAVGAIHLAARRLRQTWRALPILLAGLGASGWLVLCEHQAAGLAVTGGWLAGSVTLLAAHRAGARQRYLELGLLTLTAAAIRWLIADAMMDRLRGQWDPMSAMPFLNGQMAMALAIAVAGLWASRLLARRGGTPAASSAWQTGMVLGWLFTLIGLSFEVAHALERLEATGRVFALSFPHLEQLALTLLWSAGALGAGVLCRVLSRARPDGTREGPPVLVGFAWSLLIICAGKWIAHDTLYWALLEGSGRTIAATPLLNAQMLIGISLAAAGTILVRLNPPVDLGGAPPPGAARGGLSGIVPAAAALLVLWGLSFEVDRALGRAEGGGAGPWPPLHLRSLWWTALWASGGLAMMLWGHLRRGGAMAFVGWLLLALSAVVWLGPDTLAWRAQGPALARLVFNVQAGVGAAIAGMLAAAAWLVRHRPLPAPPRAGWRPEHVAWVLMGLIGLWLGSLELDRYAALREHAQRLAPDAADMMRQTAFSIFWALYAIGAVALGFVRRWPACRYAGLGLLTLTLVKVLTVDMAEVRALYRVLSLLGVGLLLVATSVAYAKLAPRLLRPGAGGAPHAGPPR